jgi:hypothetical protein
MAHGDFPDRRDMRMGGNMERANVGAQYVGSPRDYYGGPSRGSPMIDIRYENYQAPHRVDYTSPRQTGTRNVSGPVGGPRTFSNTYPSTDFYGPPWSPPKQHPNPRMRGMGGGLGGMQEQAGLWQDIKRILKNTKNPGPLIDQWTDHWMKSQRMAGNDTGIGSTDEYQMAYSPGTYDDDDYGPFITPSVIEMDLEGIDYDPADEYDYDRKRGWPGHVWDSPPVYSARGGLMSLRR